MTSFSIFLLFLCATHLKPGFSLKVISTLQDQILPEKYGFAEILNSSLKAYDRFSVCGRFLTHQFRSHPDTFKFQTILSAGSHYLLASFSALSCDHLYPGCLRMMKSQLGKDWKYKNIVGYVNLGRSDDYSFFPSWRPAR